MSELQAIAELLGMLLLEPRWLMLTALLLLAAVIDWRTLRIPNWLTVGGALLGLLLSVLMPPSPQMGLGSAFGGLALGLALMLPLYVLGVMGAGDVKLMAAVGSFLGVPATLHAVLFVFVTGALAALGAVALRRAWAPLWANLRGIGLMLRIAPETVLHPQGALASLPSVGKLPYGVSICAGTLAYLVSRQLGFV